MAKTLKIYTDRSIATVDLDFDDYQAIQMGEDIVAPSRENLDWWRMMLKRDFYL